MVRSESPKTYVLIPVPVFTTSGTLASQLTCLDLSFLTCKMGKRPALPHLQSYYETQKNALNTIKCYEKRMVL